MRDKGKGGFLRLLMPNQKRIFAYILMLVPNYSDAEDIMQEVAQLLWEKYAEYIPNTDFVAWALSIARFKVFEYYKERKRTEQRLSKETVRVLEMESSKLGLDYGSKLDALKKCMNRLNVDDYKLIQLRYEADQKVKNIACRYGCSIHQVYRNLTRVHNLLLSCVKRQFHHGEVL